MKKATLFEWLFCFRDVLDRLLSDAELGKNIIQ